jgi:hypothetical protein
LLIAVGVVVALFQLWEVEKKIEVLNYFSQVSKIWSIVTQCINILITLPAANILDSLSAEDSRVVIVRLSTSVSER